MEAMAQTELPKRPLPVLLLQLALAFVMAWFTWKVAVTLYWVGGIMFRDSAQVLVFFIASRLAFLWFMGFVLWALATRKRYARWLGLLCILVIPAANLYQHFFATNFGATPPGFVPSSSAERVGMIFGEGFAFILIAWWFYSFGFSRKAKTFFGVERKQGQT